MSNVVQLTTPPTGAGTRTGASQAGGDSRFACRACGVGVAVSDALVETRDDALVFSRLAGGSPGDEDKAAARAVACRGCDQTLGSRGETGAFLLRKDRVVQRAERLEILVCSLKQQEISDLSTVLEDAFPHSNISGRVLLKAELRGFQLAQRPMPDLVVVVHRNEGRVLLTDRNGFYHDVLGSAWQQTHGNVLVVLTKVEQKAEGDLFDRQLLKSLSTQGDQPTIGAISAVGRVLTWGSSPSRPQLQQLHLLASRAYLHEPVGDVPGIPVAWQKKAPKASSAAASTWCNLL